MKKASTKKEMTLILLEGREYKEGVKEVSLAWTKDWQNASPKMIAAVLRHMTNALNKGIKNDEKRK